MGTDATLVCTSSRGRRPSLPSLASSRSKIATEARLDALLRERGKLETSKFSYDGEWRDGKKHGEGSCRYHDNGDDYEGSWAEDKWHGHGVWTLRGEDGSVHEKFVGDMLNGQMHGNGRYQYADGSHYDGQWPVTCVEIRRHRRCPVAAAT